MQILMQTNPPVRRTTADRLLAVARGSRFEGSLYTTASGAPLAATDGHVLVVLGVTSAEQASAALVDAVPGDCLPPADQIRRTLTSAARDVVASATAGREMATVTLTTPADPALAARAADARVALVQSAEADLVTREARLAALVEAKRRDGSIATAREHVTEARARLRDAKANRTPASDAVVVGEAAFDLRLIRKCLKALGAKSGGLATAGEYDPAILYADGGGIALVMPFRR